MSSCKDYTKKDARIQIKQEIKFEINLWKLLSLMSSSKEYIKNDAIIQIKQELKSKEILGNFFL